MYLFFSFLLMFNSGNWLNHDHMACAVNADWFGCWWHHVIVGDVWLGAGCACELVIGGCCSNGALSWQVEQLKDELAQSEAQGEELKKQAAELQQEISAVRNPENRRRPRTALLPSPERVSCMYSDPR